MKAKTIVYLLTFATILLASCKPGGSKSEKNADPLDVIETLSNDISSNSDEWTKENWDDAADMLENAIGNLPDPMTDDESTIVSSALSRMRVYGERHRRKASGLLEAIGKFTPATAESAPAEDKEKKAEPKAPAAAAPAATVATPPVAGLLPAHVIREGGYTNVRQGPGSNYPIVTKVKDGSAIYYTTYNASWCNVYNTAGELLGYMHTSKVIPDGAPAAPAKSRGVATGTGYDWLSTQYITENDLYNLDLNDLRILRNSIYARHGRLFKDANLRRFFNSQPWYNGYRNEIPAGELNKYEKYNIQFIQNYEK